MTRKHTQEYDWLNDPFDDKKTAEELERARGSKLLGCGLAVVVVAAFALIAFAFFGILGVLGAGGGI